MATNLLAGTATLTVNGQSYALRGQFGYRPGTAVGRKTISGMDGVHGYSEKVIPGQIKAQLTDTGALSVASINQMTNVTVVAQLANGKVIVGSGMWTVGDDAQNVDSEEAQFDVIWEGIDVSEN
jgi:hypothetical protein